MKEKVYSTAKYQKMILLAALFIFLGGVACGDAMAQSCIDPIVISPPSLPNGEIYVPYNVTISATGGMGSYSFSVYSGSLPYGLTLDSYGLLSGTAYTPGVYNFEISAYDYYCYTTGYKSYTLTIVDPCGPITISPPSLPDAYVDQYYSVTLSGSGGTAPYHFYGCGDNIWPPWLNFSSEGILSGLPTEEGVYYLMICAEDSCGSAPFRQSGGTDEFFAGSGSISLTLTVRRTCPVIRFSPSDLPGGVLGSPYSQTIVASGGTPPYFYSHVRGTIPPGLTFTSGGNLSGTPAEPGKFTFYISATDAEHCTDEMLYSVSVGCETDYGTLGGHIGIPENSGSSLYLLNGSGVTGTVTASSSSGNLFTADLVQGSFSFGSIPAGDYALSATINYTDNVIYDASLLSYGCAAPGQKLVNKTAILPPKIATVKCDTHNSVTIFAPPPVVMLHGSFDCYSKWYSSDPADPDHINYMDNYARSAGFISYTPNYNWWSGSWSLRLAEVLDQINKDMSSLCASGIPPYVILTHNMGGLIVRMMGSDLLSSAPVVRKIRKAYLLGVPNSGTDYNARLGKNSLLGPNSIIRYFNEVYPDFGSIDVYAVAGTHGWWGTTDNDGLVSTDSVFNINRIACRGDDCVSYPAVKLANGPGHTVYFNHAELGSPVSVPDIIDLILASQERSTPEAPVGGVGWGTVGHTSSMVTVNSGSFLANTELAYPFTVSKCDGIAIVIKVTSGSADFRFVDPAGSESIIQDGLFLKTSPAPGECSLKVTPGQSGVAFDAVVIDNSIFGISAYLTSQSVVPGESTTVRVDKKGDWSLVAPQSVQAFLHDSQGNLLQTVTLTEKGSYFSGDLNAPSTTGSYELFVKAVGNYSGAGFSRVEFETLNVLDPSHLFSGAFSDNAADADGNGIYDTILLSGNVSLPGAGYYVVTADLYDSAGNFVSHASDDILSDSAASLPFSLGFLLGGINCSQFSGKFNVAGLKLLDGSDLKPLDVWNSQIDTRSYQSSLFECSSGTLSPVVSYVTPARVTAGTVTNIAVAGKNFHEDAEVVFGSGITVLKTERYDNRIIFASVNIPPSASTGYCTVKVVNPGGRTGTLSGVFVVAADAPPNASFEYLYDGSIVSGTLNIAVNAADDIKVESVSFELDGVQQSTVSSFPFTWAWDTSKSGTGNHTVSAKATDSTGQQTAIHVTVNVLRGPTVSSIGKKGDPFRFIVLGTSFQPGISVYIDGTRWTNIKFKSSGKIVIKGGSALKAKVPKGAPATFRFVNSDGGEQSVVWQW